MTVQKACKDILIKEPFYGFILMSLNKHVTQNEARCKTLQVELHGISFTLVVNETQRNFISEESKTISITESVLPEDAVKNVKDYRLKVLNNEDFFESVYTNFIKYWTKKNKDILNEFEELFEKCYNNVMKIENYSLEELKK